MPGITGPYADFLRRTACAVGLYSRTRFSATGDARDADIALREAVEERSCALDELHRRVPDAVRDDPDALSAHGTLLAQARRSADQVVRR
ncbi:hypothetical protein [Streptomyces sp. HM190]|uniref:hypothetical protein n=1 Tax=Streptomyces sp. HM190 TaxID=2695266 RepID=UPI00135AB892|nr:hypothetical protein [Streptomyces sp. HM190]